MAKFYGKIGFVILTETTPGVWEEVITERAYHGDVLRFSYRNQSGGEVNDNVTISNRISIVADPFARGNISSIKFVEFMGAKWKITNIEVQRPRLILEIGGVYNGQ